MSTKEICVITIPVCLLSLKFLKELEENNYKLYQKFYASQKPSEFNPGAIKNVADAYLAASRKNVFSIEHAQPITEYAAIIGALKTKYGTNSTRGMVASKEIPAEYSDLDIFAARKIVKQFTPDCCEGRVTTDYIMLY